VAKQVAARVIGLNAGGDLIEGPIAIEIVRLNAAELVVSSVERLMVEVLSGVPSQLKSAVTNWLSKFPRLSSASTIRPM